MIFIELSQEPGTTLGTSQVLSHLTSWGAWKQADKRIRRKSRLTEISYSLAQGQKQRSSGAHALPGAALSTLHMLT